MRELAIRWLVFAALVLMVAANAQVGTPGLPMVPLGYCQLSSTQLESAIGLSWFTNGIPASATMGDVEIPISWPWALKKALGRKSQGSAFPALN
jgi:hypothetical protein